MSCLWFFILLCRFGSSSLEFCSGGADDAGNCVARERCFQAMLRVSLVALVLVTTAAASAQFSRLFRGGSQPQQPQAQVQPQQQYAPAPEVAPPAAERSDRSGRATAQSRREESSSRQNSSSSSSRSSRSSRSSSRGEDSSRSSGKEKQSAKATKSTASDEKKESSSRPDLTAEEREALRRQEKEEKERLAAQQELLKAADQATTVVNDFLNYAQKGEYSKAEELLSAANQKYFASELAPVYGPLKLVLDGITHAGDILRVTYSNISVRGEGAHVDVEIEYRAGGSARWAFELVKVEKDKWRITLPVGPHAQALAASVTQTTGSAVQTSAPARQTIPVAQTTNEVPAAATTAKTAPSAGVPAVSTVAATSAPVATRPEAAAGNEPISPAAAPGETKPQAAMEEPEALPIRVATAAPSQAAAPTTSSALADAPWAPRR